MLPAAYRRFLVAVGLFGAGDFAHTLLILLATQKLIPMLGVTKAASIAIGLYVLHNIFYAAFAFVAGWLADRFRKNLVLATGYALAAVMAIILLGVFDYHYPSLFAVTLVPGLIAVGVILFLVTEKQRTPVPHIGKSMPVLSRLAVSALSSPPISGVSGCADRVRLHLAKAAVHPQRQSQQKRALRPKR